MAVLPEVLFHTAVSPLGVLNSLGMVGVEVAAEFVINITPDLPSLPDIFDKDKVQAPVTVRWWLTPPSKSIEPELVAIEDVTFSTSAVVTFGNMSNIFGIIFLF